MDNAVVLDEKSIMNPEGLRHSDEFARHKVLDAVGDIYIAGGPMIGHYEASKPGHNMNNRILHELFSSDDNWEWVDLYMDASDMPAGQTVSMSAMAQNAVPQKSVIAAI
jgi:UDP-3-O-[3-hydroxymyristoyl] N-acetylglucosamine deacetylase